MRSKEVYVGRFEDGWLDIYVVGYPEEGESILGVVRDGEDCKYIFLVDNYEYSHSEGIYNHIGELMRSIGADHIDAFLWTHPDLDHSLGIPRILDLLDKERKATVYMPPLDGIRGLKEEAQEAVDYLYDEYSKKGSRKYKLKTIDLDEDGENDDETVIAKGLFCLKIVEKNNITGAPLSCVFKFMSPFREYVDRYRHYQIVPNFNDLSLSVALSVNGRNLLLCGDIEDRTIRRIDDNCLHDVVYVKIPHHASATSSSLMFERLQKNDTTDAVATTTTFKANKLPDMGLLGKYKFISKEVYSTGSNEAHLYGCIKSSVHLADFNIVTSCDGSAVAV